MDATQFQGLFYLTAGGLAFTLLAFGLRLVGLRSAKPVDVARPVDEIWREREPLRIVEIIEETHDIRTFRFARANGKPFPSYAAGQFLSFQIGDDPKSLRSYSIASSAVNPTVLAVAVKRLKDGHGSGWFHGRKAGDLVMAFPPSGHFTDAALGNEMRVFVAGGIGITPFLSMIQTALDRGRQHKIMMIYGARSTRDLAYHAILGLLAARHPQITYLPVLSNENDHTWQGTKGYVTAELLKKHVPVTSDAHYFFCGPAIMTDNIMKDLLAGGVEDARIHSEKFASPTEFDPATIPHREAQIGYLGRKVAYSGRMTLLESLEHHGIELPFACRVGVCGTCKCLIKGKVHEITDAGLTPAERQRGIKLPCVVFPLENLELEDVS